MRRRRKQTTDYRNRRVRQHIGLTDLCYIPDACRVTNGGKSTLCNFLLREFPHAEHIRLDEYFHVSNINIIRSPCAPFNGLLYHQCNTSDYHKWEDLGHVKWQNWDGKAANVYVAAICLV